MTTTSSSSGLIQLSGLGGFDSTSVVSQLTAIAQQPVDAITTQISNIDSAKSTFTAFQSSLTSLQSAFTALSTSSGFVSMGATSSDSTSLVGSVTGNAASGSYNVSVSQLATASKLRSDTQTSSTTALGQAGTLSLQVGSGTAVNINVVATDTLTDVAAKIARSGARVSAGVINAGGSYRLQIQGLDTGAASAVAITEGGSISLGLGKSTNVVQPAQDAKLKIDGLDVTSASNSVANAIPGLTLALTKTISDSSPVTMSVQSSPSSVEAKIKTLVTAYNSIVSGVHSVTGYGTTKATNTVLQADPVLRSSLNKMSSMIAGAVTGATSPYTSMSSVGLSLGTDGTMTFDSTKFETALSANPDAVSRLFVTDTSTGATGLMSTMSTLIGNFTKATTGSIATKIASYTTQEASLQKTHDAKQKTVDAYQASLKAKFAALDQAMSKYSAMTSQLSSLSA